MKRFILIFLPVLLITIIVFGIAQLIFFQNNGKGALQITSQPFSKVYLNNKYLGNTPFCRCESSTTINSGEYTLRLVPLSGKFMEFQNKITINKGALTVVDRKFGIGASSEGTIMSLQRLKDNKASELLVVSLPDKADLYLDANKQGITPFHLNHLTNSDHTLSLKKAGYKDKNILIRTPQGYKLVAIIYLGIQDIIQTPTASTESALTPQVLPSISKTPALTTKIIILQTPNGFLRVRNEPSLNALEINRVLPNDSYTLLDENPGWYKIQPRDGSSGWVSAQYAKKL
jgi:hypothetical protein